MGGRLTEFDRVDMLTLTGGRLRPVDGPKQSAVPVGSHLPGDRPVMPRMDVAVGARSLEFVVQWAIRNDTAHALVADFRMKLSHRKRFRDDETWFEYHPENREIKADIVWDKTNGQHRIVTSHGGSKQTRAKPIHIAPAGTTTMRMGFTIPGRQVSSTMTKFWKDQDGKAFNLLVAVYQLTAKGPVKLQEHEFEDVLRLSAASARPKSGSYTTEALTRDYYPDE